MACLERAANLRIINSLLKPQPWLREKSRQSRLECLIQQKNRWLRFGDCNVMKESVSLKKWVVQGNMGACREDTAQQEVDWSESSHFFGLLDVGGNFCKIPACGCIKANITRTMVDKRWPNGHDSRKYGADIAMRDARSAWSNKISSCAIVLTVLSVSVSC